MSYRLPDLPYDYGALEPHIDGRTLEFHHDKHHRTYVNKLNDALENHPELRQKPIEELLSGLASLPAEIRAAVRDNGGGHYNHSLMWSLLTPDFPGEPKGGLADALDRDFGGFSAFRERFAEAAKALFGSGYVWLCLNADDRLEMVSLPNQDTPLDRGLAPLFLMDLWEHAYYLKHQNRRPEYVESYWNVVNWDEVAVRWDEARRRVFTESRKAG